MNCPSTLLTYELMNCVLTVVTSNTVFEIKIDFGDKDIKYYSLNDSSVEIIKAYNASGTYMINATVSNTGFYVCPLIDGRYIYKS